MFEIEKTEIEGFVKITPKVIRDNRGEFVKIFSSTFFNSLDISFSCAEQYYSISKLGVLRGFHFQTPPYQHDKLVASVSGSVLDIALDLRKSSPTFGKSVAINLSSEKGEMVFLKAGLAHAFYTLSETACLLYSVSSEYFPEADCGVSWRSSDLWGEIDPVTSERDQQFPLFRNFDSPF